MERTVTLEEIGERAASDLLREVARGRESLRIILEGGETVAIASSTPQAMDSGPAPTPLKPLPQLEGFVPHGWKEAVYEIDELGQ